MIIILDLWTKYIWRAYDTSKSTKQIRIRANVLNSAFKILKVLGIALKCSHVWSAVPRTLSVLIAQFNLY